MNNAPPPSSSSSSQSGEGHDRRTDSAASEPSTQLASAIVRMHERERSSSPPVPKGGVPRTLSPSSSNTDGASASAGGASGGGGGPAFLTRRQRTCVSSLAAIIVYLCWNLRYMSSSLQMLAMLPVSDGSSRSSNHDNQQHYSTSPRNNNGTATTTTTTTVSSSPSICLLMTFPNSGTSYTLKNTQLLSGRIVATNYADEAKTRWPLFEQSPGQGEPVVVGPFIVNASFGRTDVVLTKTHCNMNTNFESFEVSCRSVRRWVNGTAVEAPYPIERVGRVVHLIRNPFDNVVARMHHGINKYRGVLPNATLDSFTNDPAGFHNWCQFLDATFGKKLRILLPNATQALLRSVPCHSDFLHYIGWHNFALEFVRVHNLRRHSFHYEDYGTDFSGTTMKLFEFLGLTAEGEPAPFVAGKVYGDFYDASERGAISELLRQTCSPPVWKLVRRYLPPSADHDDPSSRSNASETTRGGRETNDPPFGSPSFFATTSSV